jgi:hypothetical protein
MLPRVIAWGVTDGPPLPAALDCRRMSRVLRRDRQRRAETQ